MESIRRTAKAYGAPVFGVVVFFLFVYPSPYFKTLNNPNENVRLYMTAALVEEGTVEITHVRKRWGWVNDAACVVKDKSTTRVCKDSDLESSKQYFSVKGPGTSAMGALGYSLERLLSQEKQADLEKGLFWSRLVGTALPTLFFSMSWFLWMKRYPTQKHLGVLLWVGLMMGTCLYGYALLFVSHALAGCMGMFAYVLMRDNGASFPMARWFLIGCTAAGMTALEYTAAWCSLCLTLMGAWQLWNKRRVLTSGGVGVWASFLSGLFLPTIMTMWFQKIAFGSPWTPGHIFAETAEFRAYHHQGLYGVSRFELKRLMELMFSKDMGLLLMSPLAALGMLGTMQKKNWGLLFLWGGTCALVSTMPNYRGGWTLGPRLVAFVIPFVMLGVPEFLLWLESMVGTGISVWVLCTCVFYGVKENALHSVQFPHFPEFAHPREDVMFKWLLSQDMHHILFQKLALFPWAIALGVLICLAVLRLNSVRLRLGMCVWLLALCSVQALKMLQIQHANFEQIRWIWSYFS